VIAKPRPLSNYSFDKFEAHLKAQKKRNVRQIMCYVQKYQSVLETQDATPIVNIQNGSLRRHAIEALTDLSKYQGCYNRWQQIRKDYSLKGTTGDESLQSLERFFNEELTLDKMIRRI
jgi:hypothetical protein